jgi:hypothetical protein
VASFRWQQLWQLRAGMQAISTCFCRLVPGLGPGFVVGFSDGLGFSGAPFA